MTAAPSLRPGPVLVASACAATMIATQVAGKTARDSLFLTNYDIAALPLVLVASALLSLGAVLLTSRGVATHGPFAVVPPFFLASGVLLVGEWLLAAVDVRLAALLVYLHIAVIGAILISGFWSIINECFDPRSARQSIGRIVGGATAGGLLGGLLAERVGAVFGILWVLPVIAGLHVLCALLLLRLRPYHLAGEPSSPAPQEGDPARPAAESGLRVLRRVPYLRDLALVVLLGNVAATLVDFLFKAQAARSFATGAELVRFFAVFYTVVSLITLAVQAGLTRRLIAAVGIANTMMVRPALLTAGGLLAAPFLGLASLGFLRSLEAVVQGSVHRSGYELLYASVVPGDRRNTKTIVDVGADRVGDIAGGLLARLVIFLPAAISGQVVLLLAVAIACLALVVARALHDGYVRALEARLIDRATMLDLKQDDPSTMPTLMASFTGFDVSLSLADLALDDLRREATTPPPSVPPAALPALADPELAALLELRSGDAQRVRTQLRRLRSLSPVVAGQITSLLAWDDVTVWASRALARAAPAITGQLADRLLDPDEDFAIRRRIPRILATTATPRARDALLAALADRRFEVRYQAGAALASLLAQSSSLAPEPGLVHEAVLRETRVDPRLWQEQRLLDDPPLVEATDLADPALRARSSRSLEHVFALLSLVLPRTPLQITYQGLLTSDAVLRGTSLEYLESGLPRDVWESLRPYLGEQPGLAASRRSREEVLEDLLRSRQSIELSLRDLRKQVGEA